MDSREDEVLVEIPSYFVCPISLQLMRDPITVCTGVTYDRESIEKWIYSCGKKTCPATMQVLENHDLTPNHTLRRLIQGWCDANSSKGVVRIPTPRPPVDSTQVAKLLHDVECPPFQVNALKKLRGLVAESERNRRCISAAGACDVLISVIEMHSVEMDQNGCFEGATACEEALGALYCLAASDESAELLAVRPKCIRSMAWILKRGSCNARFHAAMLFKNISMTATQELEMNANDDLFEGLLELLTEEVSHQATIAALEVLMAICPTRKNRIKAIEAGAVSALIELLPESQRRTCEKMLALLDVLCGCAEGRAAMTDHAMGIAVISKKILRVSQVGTEKAVRILWSLCKFSPTPRVIHEMMQVGAVPKLCMLLQLHCTSKTRLKAKEVLKLHGKNWRSSPCIPLHLLNIYPSNNS
eukprot:Gb_02490 [translate_table: standard]